MLNYVWIGMLAAGFVIGMINGRLEEVTQAAFNSAGRAVELSIGLLGILCLWSGLMKIAEKSGLIKVIARLSRPLLKLLFPQIARDNRALGAIVMNLSANFLGLGNAATPLGIKAMHELKRLNPDGDRASDPMCMFLVLNTSAIQLIPATVIAIRADAGSTAPAEIIVCVWIVSVCATISGIAAVKLLSGSGNANRPGIGRIGIFRPGAGKSGVEKSRAVKPVSGILRSQRQGRSRKSVRR